MEVRVDRRTTDVHPTENLFRRDRVVRLLADEIHQRMAQRRFRPLYSSIRRYGTISPRCPVSDIYRLSVLHDHAQDAPSAEPCINRGPALEHPREMAATRALPRPLLAEIAIGVQKVFYTGTEKKGRDGACDSLRRSP